MHLLYKEPALYQNQRQASNVSWDYPIEENRHNSKSLEFFNNYKASGLKRHLSGKESLKLKVSPHGNTIFLNRSFKLCIFKGQTLEWVQAGWSQFLSTTLKYFSDAGGSVGSRFPVQNINMLYTVQYRKLMHLKGQPYERSVPLEYKPFKKLSICRKFWKHKSASRRSYSEVNIFAICHGPVLPDQLGLYCFLSESWCVGNTK